MKIPIRANRLRWTLGLALICGLAPVAALAEPAVMSLLPGTAAATAPAEDTQTTQEAVPGQALVLYRASDDTSMRMLDSTNDDELAQAGFDVAQTWDFSAVDRALDQGTIELQSDEAEADALPSGEDLRIALVERAGADVDDLIAELEALDFVVAAQPNYVVNVDSASTPTDPLYADWQYNMTSATAGIDLDAALAARADTPDREQNIVAVVDTGVDASHPDLADHMWENPGIEGLPGEAGDHGYDFCDGDGDPTPGSAYADSHGTHCAGVIAGTANNGEGIAGASSDTQIMALKVAPENGGGNLYLNSAISAYQYLIGAALAGENVVAASNSWEIGGYAPVLDYLVNQAGKLGILSVFAAGNASSDTDDVTVGATVGLESPYAVIIASSNRNNTLSSFSNWSETDVDLAFPGSSILSTVSTGAAHAFFSPTISLACGKDLAYADDFSDFSMDSNVYRVQVLNSDGTPVSPETKAAFSIEPVADTGHGVAGLKVAVDPSKTDKAAAYIVSIDWSFDNPFLGAAHTADDYALGTSGLIDASSPDNIQIQINSGLAAIRDGETIYLSGNMDSCFLNDDNSQIYGTSLAGIDTEVDQLRATVQTYVGPSDGVWADEPATFYIEPYGIGLVSGEGVDEETSDYAPYGLMSGTSMATPMASGTIGQLAALDPDASALELRGRLVGSTTPVDTTYLGVEKHTATDGRFTWDVALDENEVGANTWAVDADPATGAVTVYGYALADADVTLDGKAVELTACSDSQLTFTAPAEAFDGATHRIDVHDRSCGRTHRASYSLPARGASYDIAWADDLPGIKTESESSGALVSTEDALYYTSGDGSYLYRMEHPSSGVWTSCAAPGNPWPSGASDAQAAISYTAVGRDLVAFTTAADGYDLSVYYATYSADDDTWTPFTCIGTLENTFASAEGTAAVGSVFATTVDGRPCALVSASFSDATFQTQTVSAIAFQKDSEDAPVLTELDTAGDAVMPTFAPMTPVAHDGELYLLGYPIPEAADGTQSTPVDQTYEMHAYVIDTKNGAVKDRGTVAGMDALTASAISDLQRAVTVPFANGVLVIRAAQRDTGDTLYIDLDKLSCKSTAWLAAQSGTGMTITSAAAFEGSIYLTALDASAAATGLEGALYTLPYAAAEQLCGILCPTADYTDLDSAAWYHEAVDWVVSANVMSGVDAAAGVFDPSGTLTRAQMAQILYNMAGSPAVEGTAPYADCERDAWYNDAVAWCAQEQIFQGYEGTDLFGPNDALSREQMATILWRMAAPETAGGDLSHYSDGSTISSWATEAVSWAVGEGYLRGIGGTTELQPQGDLTRAQAATVLMRAERSDFPFPGSDA